MLYYYQLTSCIEFRLERTSCAKELLRRVLKDICIIFPPVEGRAGVGHKSLALTESVCAVSTCWRETVSTCLLIQKLSLVSQLVQPQKTSPSGRGRT